MSAYRREKKVEWQPLEIDEPPFAGTAGIAGSESRAALLGCRACPQ
jgi:hypothetical protein